MLDAIKTACQSLSLVWGKDNKYSNDEELRTFFNAEYKGCGQQAFEYWMQTGSMNFSC